MSRIILIIVCCLMSTFIRANDNGIRLTPEQFQLIVDAQKEGMNISKDSLTIQPVKFRRGKAILFTVLTGLLGGHRIYFGTHHRTPIIYTVTLGGFGILPLIDLVHIIFTKDLSIYQDKSKIIMWGQ